MSREPCADHICLIEIRTHTQHTNLLLGSLWSSKDAKLHQHVVYHVPFVPYQLIFWQCVY